MPPASWLFIQILVGKTYQNMLHKC